MFSSEYCDVYYEEGYNIAFVKWKKFCFNDDYRKPLGYALEIIKQHRCNYAADTRTGFENTPEDTKWVADYFMPQAHKYGCQCIYFIIDENNPLKEELEGQEKASDSLMRFKYIFGLEDILKNEQHN